MSRSNEKTKHTPGPWIVNTEHDITTADGKHIICNTDIGIIDEPFNAQLIAAAPEMLEQLVLVQAYLLEKGVQWVGIDSVIAKAGGES